MKKNVKAFIIFIMVVIVALLFWGGYHAVSNWWSAESTSVPDIEAEAKQMHTKSLSNRISLSQRNKDAKESNKLYKDARRDKKDQHYYEGRMGKTIGPAVAGVIVISLMIASSDDEFYIDN